MRILAILLPPHGEVLEFVAIDESCHPRESFEALVEAEAGRLHESYGLPNPALEFFEGHAPSIDAFFTIFAGVRRTERTLRRPLGDGSDATLTFCGRCGAGVRAYPPGSVTGDNRYIYGDPQPDDEHYDCPRCGRQPSPCMVETGRACPRCMLFNPLGLAFCAYCGGPMT
jgi:hypothetical protein